MKAIQLIAPGKPEIVEVPVPEIADNEVLVEVRTCVTCPHWDMTLFKGVDIIDRPGHPRYPIPWGFPGHEMSGVVIKAGSGVQTLIPGDRVAATTTAGTDKPGFYCEYINRPESELVKLPDHVSFDAGACFEMAVGVSPNVRKLGDISGKRVGVVGLGPAGIIAIQMLKALGADDIVAMDLEPSRLEMAKQAGATESIVTSDPEAMGRLADNRLHACMDCSGHASGLQVAMDHTSGMVSVFGVLHGEAKITMQHWLNAIQLVTSLPVTAEDKEFVLQLLQEDKLNMDILVSARLPFEQYEEAVGLLFEKKALKVAMYPTRP